MKTLTVWGGLTFNNGKQIRAVVATYTKKKAMELLGFTYRDFEQSFCETGNTIELQTALAKPETLFFASHLQGKDFMEVDI